MLFFPVLAFFERRALFLFFMEFLSRNGLWVIAFFSYFLWLLKGGKKAVLFVFGFIILTLLLWFSNAFYHPYELMTDYDEKSLVHLTETLISSANENYTDKFEIRSITQNAPRVMKTTSGRVIAFSYPELMDSLNLSGIFIPLNGRCYLNKNEKAFLLPFVASHELSHRKGIVDEGQANIDAFFHCIKSDITFFRYSACLYALKYALCDLKYKNEAEAIRLEYTISDRVMRDLNQMNVFLSNAGSFWKNYQDLVPGLLHYQSITSHGVI